MTKLEKLFFDAWKETAKGFPEPEMQYLIDGQKFDFAWPDWRICVECDGIGWGHAKTAEQERNAMKQNSAVILGWKPLRFTSACLNTKAKRVDAVQHVLYLMGEDVI